VLAMLWLFQIYVLANVDIPFEAFKGI